MTNADEQATRIAQLEADNLRLRRLLNDSNVPAELRHRTRNTIAILRSVIRHSAVHAADVDSYVMHLEGRLDAISRAQISADVRGVVSLYMLVTEELLQYGLSEGPRFLLDGPEVEFRPKVGQLMSLVVHELAINAVEHGSLGIGGGQVEIKWIVTRVPNSRFTFCWRELQPDLQSQPTRKGFGTEVLTKMIPYELDADAQLSFSSGGVSYRASLPFEETVGALV